MGVKGSLLNNNLNFDTDVFLNYLNHSYKKQKDTMETRVKLAVLRTYVENQAVLKPIFFIMRQNVNKPKNRTVKIVYGPILLPFYVVIIRFFLFPVKMTI